MGQKEKKKVTLASNIINYPVKPGDFIFFNSYMPHAYSHFAGQGKEKFRFIHFNMAATLDLSTVATTETQKEKK